MTLNEVINTTNKKLQSRYNQDIYVGEQYARQELEKSMGKGSNLQRHLPFIVERGVKYRLLSGVLEIKAKRKKLRIAGKYNSLSYVSYEVSVDTLGLAGKDIKEIADIIQSSKNKERKETKDIETQKRERFNKHLSGNGINQSDFIKAMEMYRGLSIDNQRAVMGVQ